MKKSHSQKSLQNKYFDFIFIFMTKSILSGMKKEPKYGLFCNEALTHIIWLH